LHLKTLFLSTFLLSLAGAAFAGNVQVDYALNLGSGTLNGSSVTSIAIFEERAGVVNVSFPYTVPGSGEFVLSHTAPFDPTLSLIVGLDLPSTTGGDTGSDNKTHLVFFTNDAFAQSAAGIQFSTVFQDTRHSDFINRLQLAEGGDASQVTWLTNFFEGVGHDAAFATGTQSTAIEFSSGTVLAPEPMSFGFVGIGLAALVVARRRFAGRSK
jgi:hypothetical protein